MAIHLRRLLDDLAGAGGSSGSAFWDLSPFRFFLRFSSGSGCSSSSSFCVSCSCCFFLLLKGSGLVPEDFAAAALGAALGAFTVLSTSEKLIHPFNEFVKEM